MSDTSTAAFCCCDNWILFRVVLTGSGIGTETVSCEGCAAKRPKFGQEKFGKEKFGKETFGKEKLLKFGKEKFGKEKRSKSGRELAVAAPMMARADKDTTIAGTRLEAACRAAGGC